MAVSLFWLTPRLPDFKTRFPDIEVKVIASDADLSNFEDKFDIGIQYGHGKWPEYGVTFLGPGEVVPVCSPQLFSIPMPFDRPEDLLRQPLLQLIDERLDWVSWPAWFRAAGIGGPYPSSTLIVNNYLVLQRAAFEGAGIALGMKYLLDEHFDRDWLVVACDFRVRTGMDFYLMVPHEQQLSPDCCIVRDWIVAGFRGGQ